MPDKPAIVERLLRPTRWKRIAFFFVGDAFLIAVALASAFLLRFEFSIPPSYWTILKRALPIFVSMKLLCFWAFGTYKITWRHVGIHDLFNMMAAMGVAQLLLMVAILISFADALPSLSPLNIKGFPRSIFIIDFFISGLLVVSFRVAKRLYFEAFKQRREPPSGTPTIIVGGGVTGEMIIRDLLRNPKSAFQPVAIVDDNPVRKGQYLHGIPVRGATRHLSRLIKELEAKAVIVADAKLNQRTLRNIYDQARVNGVTAVKTVNAVADLEKPGISLKSLEEISIEDLIGRQAVEVDRLEIKEFLAGKRILITGAGGSIGAEISEQVCSFAPAEVVLFDIDETELHQLDFNLKKIGVSDAVQVFFVAGDVCDEHRIEEVFRRHRPQVVFHAAAYKHVPMMELNATEALKVNIFGTHVLARAASDHGAETFILISSDKAVRPTSIMGASKRLAEEICRSMNKNGNGTSYISVRFGNVLGSRGSVLPIFMDQLRQGGPLTVTHRDMRRYFMTIPEAVSLVLQASVIGKGGEVMVLDMGEPVSIVSLAEELIRINGLEPYRDIEIVFTGMRPGEKLFEELLTAEEGTRASRRNKIYVANTRDSLTPDELDHILVECRAVMSGIHNNQDDELIAVKAFLKQYVNHYHQVEVCREKPIT